MSKSINIIQLAQQTFGDRDFANKWLTTPKTALGGKIPVLLMSNEEGRKQVIDLLGRVEHSIYS